MKIDYSSLPSETPVSSPWSVFRVSALITIALLLVLGPIFYVANKNPDTPLQSVPIILAILAFLTIAFGAYRSLTGKLRKQRGVMQRFAQQNGWVFEGSKNSNDSDLLPAQWQFQGNNSRQLYRIRGSLDGNDFKLYTLMGVDKAPLGTGNRITLSYRTAVRTHTGISSAPNPTKVKIVTENDWQYVLMDGNAITAHELQLILRPLQSTT